MKILNVYYYNYYKFYKNLLKDPDPHVATVLALSFSESLLLNGVSDIIALQYFCYEIKIEFQFTILCFIIILNFLYCFRPNRTKIIIKDKPTIYNSKSFSILLTILFFVITTSWLFWGGIYGKYLLANCN